MNRTLLRQVVGQKFNVSITLEIWSFRTRIFEKSYRHGSMKRQKEERVIRIGQLQRTRENMATNPSIQEQAINKLTRYI